MDESIIHIESKHPKLCKGCYHYRPLFNRVCCCHYMIDTGESRGKIINNKCDKKRVEKFKKKRWVNDLY